MRTEAELNDPDQLLNPDQVAQVLQCSSRTVYLLFKAGELPSLKVRSSRRVKRSDLQEYIERCASSKVTSA